ncbi:hypothetical protein, partial [Atopobacter phocae]|uniref:hypothetical protein n=1 Tax=Atopobacter phocae TaxID=136492 RepID=UPI00054D680F
MKRVTNKIYKFLSILLLVVMFIQLLIPLFSASIYAKEKAIFTKDTTSISTEAKRENEVNEGQDITKKSNLETDSEVENIPNSAVNEGKARNIQNLKDDKSIGEQKNSKVNSNTFLTRFEVAQKPQDKVYLTGQEALIYTGFSTSESEGVIANYTVLIELPSEYVKEEGVIASDIESNKKINYPPPVIERTADKITIKYKFTNIGSGTSVDFPFTITTHSELTPNDYHLPVRVKILNQDNELIREETTQVKYKVKDSESNKQIFIGSNWTSSDDKKSEAGKVDENRSGFLTNATKDLTPVRFNFSIPGFSNSITRFGNRRYELYKIEDKLPKEAIFVQEYNKGWIYDKDTHTATYEEEKDFTLGKTTFSTKEINLLFPGADLSKKYINKIKFTGKPKNKPKYESNLVLDDDITFQLKPTIIDNTINFEKSPNYGLYDDLEAKKSYHSAWKLNITNNGKNPKRDLKNLVIKDYEQDKRLTFTKIVLPKTSKDIFDGTLDVYVKKGNQEVKIEENISLETEQKIIELDSDVQGVMIKTHNNSDHISVLKPNKTLLIKLYHKIKDPEKTKTDGENSEELNNTATVAGNYSGAENFEAKSQAKLILSPVKPTLSLSKSSTTSDKGEYLFINKEVTNNINVYAEQIQKDKQIDLTRIVDLLPEGMEYVSKSGEIKLLKERYFDYYGKDNYKKEPQIVHNYQGTGRTALIWKLNTITSKLFYSSDIRTHEITYNTIPTINTKIGMIYNEAYIGWKNNNEVLPKDDRGGSEIIKDNFDLSENGSTSDNIIKAKSEMNFQPPKILVAKKSVQGSLDRAQVLLPGIGKSEFDAEGNYVLTIYNNSSQNVTSLTAVDIFPYEDDLTLSIDKETQKRVPRKSSFSIKLLSPIVLPKGYSVFYTTSTPKMKNFVEEAKWVTTLGNYGQATAIKIELEDGYVLKSEEEVNVRIPFKTPKPSSQKKNDRAVNSFGISTSKQLLFTESNNAVLELVNYQVKGNVFEDKNRDNVLDQNDLPFKSYNVTLINKDGTPAKDLENKPIKVKTNGKGEYIIDVYRHGDYRIKIEAPKDYLLLKPIKDNIKGSHINTDDIVTDVFTLDINNPEAIKNAGYFKVGPPTR